MGTRPEELRQEIQQTRAELTRDVDRLTARTSPRQIVRRRTDAVRIRARGLRERIMGTGEHARDRFADTFADTTDSMRQNLSEAGDTVKAAPRQAMRQTKGNPLAAGLIAFGAGALAAALIPETRAERRAARQIRDEAGQYVEPVVESLKESAQSVGQDVKSVAQDSAQQIRDTAADAARTTKEQAQRQASDVRDQR